MPVKGRTNMIRSGASRGLSGASLHLRKVRCNRINWLLWPKFSLSAPLAVLLWALWPTFRCRLVWQRKLQTLDANAARKAFQTHGYSSSLATLLIANSLPLSVCPSWLRNLRGIAPTERKCPPHSSRQQMALVCRRTEAEAEAERCKSFLLIKKRELVCVSMAKFL